MTEYRLERTSSVNKQKQLRVKQTLPWSRGTLIVRADSIFNMSSCQIKKYETRNKKVWPINTGGVGEPIQQKAASWKKSDMDSLAQDFKSAICNMFKELKKKIISKELKECTSLMTCQVQNINKERCR